MRELYKRLEEMQGDVAVQRTARQEAILFVISSAVSSPELQKDLLRVCSSVTRTDVALGNLIVRSRLDV